MHLDTPIHRLDETQALLDIVARTPEFSGHPLHQSVFNWGDADYANDKAKKTLSKFVQQYLAAARNTDLDVEIFACVYSNLEEYLYRFADIPIRTTIELWHARPDVPHIFVCPGICIRPITKDEQVQFKTSFSAQIIEIDRRVSHFRHSVEYNEKFYGKYAVAPGIEAVRIGHRMLLSFRLIREGLIWLGYVRSSSPNRLIELGKDFDMTQASLRDRVFESIHYDLDAGVQPKPLPYVLTNDVARRLPILWPKIPQLGTPPIPEELNLPLRRFRSSFDRKNIADQFIDQWIALEALFSPRGGDNATHIMCQRLANYVGVSGQDRKNILHNAKGSYNARSDVVHGRKLNLEDFLRHVNTAEDYLRRSLVKSLESQKMPDKKEFDRQSALQHASASQNV
jgi:hypothetical protein